MADFESAERCEVKVKRKAHIKIESQRAPEYGRGLAVREKML
jgi:hypothetical protein